MDFDRQLRALCCAAIVLSACARSRLGIDEGPAPGGPGVGLPGQGSAGSGANSGSIPGSGVAGNGSPLAPPGGGAPAVPTAGRDGVPTAGRGTPPPGTGGRPAPPPNTGTAGRNTPPPEGPDAGIFDPLNPQRCASDHPFVLSIDPGGQSGDVQGWLESAPQVVFDEYNLPRFSADRWGPDVGGELALWWSISSLDDESGGSLYFYAVNGSMEVAHVPVNRFSAIGDARNLMFVSWDVGPVPVGEIAVFHHIPTDRYVAVQVLDLYGTEDGDRRSTCAAVDARWRFAPPGSATFSDILLID